MLMPVTTDASVCRQKHLRPATETSVFNGGNARFLHKQRISIGNGSISIRILCTMFLFWQKVAGRGVRKRTVLPPFCCEMNGWRFILYPRKQPCPVCFRYLPGCLRGCKVIQNGERWMLLWNNSYFCNLENVWAACRSACLRRRGRKCPIINVAKVR